MVGIGIICCAYLKALEARRLRLGDELFSRSASAKVECAVTGPGFFCGALAVRGVRLSRAEGHGEGAKGNRRIHRPDLTHTYSPLALA